MGGVLGGGRGNEHTVPGFGLERKGAEQHRSNRFEGGAREKGFGGGVFLCCLQCIGRPHNCCYLHYHFTLKNMQENRLELQYHVSLKGPRQHSPKLNS